MIDEMYTHNTKFYYFKCLIHFHYFKKYSPLVLSELCSLEMVDRPMFKTVKRLIKAHSLFHVCCCSLYIDLN